MELFSFATPFFFKVLIYAKNKDLQRVIYYSTVLGLSVTNISYLVRMLSTKNSLYSEVLFLGDGYDTL